MEIENSVSNDFDLRSSILLTFSIAIYPVLSRSGHLCYIVNPILLIHIRSVILSKGQLILLELASRKVSRIGKCHKHTLQTNPRHREKKQQNTTSHKTPGRQSKVTRGGLDLDVPFTPFTPNRQN